MRVCYFLLALGLSVIAGSGTLASSNQVPTLITSLDAGHISPSTNYFGRRSLRASKPVEKEERIFEAMTKWAKTAVWLNDGRSEAYVRQALKLEKLTGDTLKSAQNYKYLEHFLNALEQQTLKAKVAKFVPTRDVWKENFLDDIPIAQLKDSAGYKTYARYVNMFDDEMIRLRNNGVERPGLPKIGDPDLPPGMVRLGNKNKPDSDFSPTEMDARVDIWVTTERPKWYVAKALDLDVRSYKRSPNYAYYEKYLKGIKKRKMAVQ